MPLLSVEKLAVTFPTNRGKVYAVKELSFELEAGEILALVGESGCGKSATAMSIPRLHPPHVQIGGRITFEGVDLARISEPEMQEIRGEEISMIFQEPMTSLNPAYTAGYQISEVIRKHEGVSRAEARKRSIELLRIVGISDPEHRVDVYPHQMSGGMRQRVMIAIAVACNPKLLIADESTTALDVTIQAGILDLIRDLRDRLGMGVILITHDLGVVSELADRVIVMYAGREVEEAPVQDLIGKPRHPYTVGLRNALPSTAAITGGSRRLNEIPGLVPLPSSDPDECQFQDRCPRATAQCGEARPRLEAVAPNHRLACYHPMSATQTQLQIDGPFEEQLT